MLQFFEKYKKHILRVGALLLVLIAIVSSGKQLNTSLLESAVGVVVTPFQDLTTGISSWVEETISASRKKKRVKGGKYRSERAGCLSAGGKQTPCHV